MVLDQAFNGPQGSLDQMFAFMLPNNYDTSYHPRVEGGY